MPSRLVLLVGSNDLLKNSSRDNIKRDYLSLVRFCLRNCEKLVLIVCPAIPRKQKDPAHWDALNFLNGLVYSFKGHPKIKIVDLKTHEKNRITKVGFYEKRFPDGRPDYLHLNRVAFVALRDILETECRSDFGTER